MSGQAGILLLVSCSKHVSVIINNCGEIESKLGLIVGHRVIASILGFINVNCRGSAGAELIRRIESTHPSWEIIQLARSQRFADRGEVSVEWFPLECDVWLRHASWFFNECSVARTSRLM